MRGGIKILMWGYAFFLPFFSAAQCAPDSTRISASVRATGDTGKFVVSEPYKFRAAQLIAPVALVGLGVTGLVVEPVKEWNHDFRNNFADCRRVRFDDYVQYVPLATPYVLKLCGVKSRHSYGEYTILLATSYLSMGIMVNTLKYTIRELRPDGSSRNSFPSGHTATAFMGAELLRSEFWETSPWIGVAGYSLAATIGFMRIYNDRHWTTDVLAGAGIGILSVRIAYWTFPAMRRLFFGKSRTDGLYVSAAPYYDGSQYGTLLSVCF